jgi:hypothetical protein
MGNDYGWMIFERGKHRFVIRVKYLEGVWVDVKTDAVPAIPPDAFNIRIAADKQETRRLQL